MLRGDYADTVPKRVRRLAREVLYALYRKRLSRVVENITPPHHVAMIIDGNRRWAKLSGFQNAEHGHRVGAERMREFLGWCDRAGVSVVTLYLLSTDNLRGRASDELTALFAIIADLAGDIATVPCWNVQHIGDVDALPADLSRALQAAEQQTAGNMGMHVNLAVGYGGRHEITQAMRSIVASHRASGGSIEELADLLTPELIAEHLYTKGQPDPDLVIRTSGEQRLSDFMLWQSASSELYFVEALGPDLRDIDFYRALRDFSTRQRRYGK